MTAASSWIALSADCMLIKLSLGGKPPLGCTDGISATGEGPTSWKGGSANAGCRAAAAGGHVKLQT